MKIHSLILIAILFTSNICSSQNEDDLIFSHGPYLQNVTKTSATIIFNTNKLVVPGVLIKWGDVEFKLVQNSNNGLLEVGDNIHKIRIENLEPGKKYE